MAFWAHFGLIGQIGVKGGKMARYVPLVRVLRVCECVQGDRDDQAFADVVGCAAMPTFSPQVADAVRYQKRGKPRGGSRASVRRAALREAAADREELGCYPRRSVRGS